jgi:hypothetical protein
LQQNYPNAVLDLFDLGVEVLKRIAAKKLRPCSDREESMDWKKIRQWNYWCIAEVDFTKLSNIAWDRYSRKGVFSMY